MSTTRCMNVGCGATEPGEAGEWRKGWELRSGGFAMLCVKCGMIYEQLIFCDVFHQKESGWRECLSCGKRLHCGCIASKSFFVLLDSGGIQCIGCLNNSETSFMPHEAFHNFLPQHHQRVLALSSRSSKDEKGKNSSSGDREQRKSEHASFGNVNLEQGALEIGEVGMGSIPMSQQDESKDIMTNKRVYESLAQACLDMRLGNNNKGSKMESGSSAERQLVPLYPLCVAAETRDQNKAISAFQPMHGTHCFLLKPPKTGNGVPSDAPKDGLPHIHLARMPADGRGRNQLLPRYWPRITDQELQQISGDSNSTIVPLFEKVLSASDAGRIGRLVLPKACAEAYFPPISQPEGLPLTIQDAKGKVWHFQFRFWPNNNSRMYVLEGVTPCIQSLQLQAGDTVTFSRIDPEGKLVMGFRKATNTVSLQDSSAIPNGTVSNEKSFSSDNEKIPTVSGYPGLFQSLRGAADLNSNSQSEHPSSADVNISWHKINKHGGRTNEGLYMQPLQKKSRNISAKCRRMVMDSEDSLELKLTWEEAQDLLRPPPSAKPSIVIIEDHEIEEYEEPPIFGKKAIFTAQVSGEQDQWVQCDDCSKWRRLPVDVLLPSKWTCADNMWDPKRSSCSTLDELSQKEMQILLLNYEDLRRRALASSKQTSSELASSGLNALVAAAAPGEVGNQIISPVAITTKHPRHRPGCTCIVCIQPPSGKGPKHDPACTCSVCMTVKRRFKTLMMRKQKRQSECEEGDTGEKLACGNKEETGLSSCAKGAPPQDSHQENELGPVCSRAVVEKLEMSKGQIDLNCHPESYEDPQAGPPRVSMMSLLRVAHQPLETYLKQNGLTRLAFEHGNQGSPSLLTFPQDSGESEGRMSDEDNLTSVAQVREGGDEEHDGADVVKADDA